MCFALIYNKCGEYRFVWVFTFNLFLSKMVFLFIFAVLKRFVVCVCVILGDLGTDFSTCGFSFESTPSTMQTCLKIVHCLFEGGWYCSQILLRVRMHGFKTITCHFGFIVTTPPFTFGWFVEFKCMQIMRWNANTLIWLVLVNNLMFTSIILLRTSLSIAKATQVSLAHQSDCLTAFLVLSKF